MILLCWCGSDFAKLNLDMLVFFFVLILSYWKRLEAVWLLGNCEETAIRGSYGKCIAKMINCISIGYLLVSFWSNDICPKISIDDCS